MKARRNLFHSDSQRLLDDIAVETLLRIHRDREKVSSKVKTMLTYIEKNLFETEFTIRELKQACGIRDNNLAILFHQEVGMPPKAYLCDCRLEVAARLLRRTELPVWQIGEIVGFAWPGGFGRSFRQWAGRSPGDYRAMRHSRPPRPAPSREETSCLIVWRRALSGLVEPKKAEELIRQLESIYIPPHIEPMLPGYWGSGFRPAFM